MFYNPVYLRKRGQFGLIWLAATHSKILNKREMLAVNIRVSCNEMIQHVPVGNGIERETSRFSLYLCCQLLYGSVKVIQVQWDYLLSEVDAVYQRLSCFTRINASGKGIDAPPCTGNWLWNAKVPQSEMDPNFDPLFGILEDPIPDIESFLEALDASHRDDDQLIFMSFPAVVQPEIGSPHSVFDPRDIQISDADDSLLSPMLPDEHDLPKMDQAGLQEFLSLEPLSTIQEEIMDETERETFLPPEVHDQPAFEEIERPFLFQDEAREVHEVHPQSATLLEGDVIATTAALEETPLSKPASDMPAPPKKPRPGKTIKTKPNTDTGKSEQKDDNVEDVPQGEERQISDNVVNVQEVVVAEEVPQPRFHRGHDWEERNPPVVQLSPVIPDQSPIRKRRPHRLIIDSSLMISKTEIKEHLKNTEDIISPFEIHTVANLKEKRRNPFKEPYHEVLQQNKDLIKLFTRNCKFGLRTDDSGSEGDSISLPDTTKNRKRVRRLFEEEESLPPKVQRPSEELPSVERGRDGSSRFSHLSDVDRNLSHSIIARSGDESISSIRGERNSLGLQDISTGSAQLPTWLEEPEINLNAMPVLEPFPEELPQDLTQNGELPAPYPDFQQPGPDIVVNGLTEMNGQNLEQEIQRERILILVKNHLRTRDDTTTFRMIFPPEEYTRNSAASFFFDLCYQVSIWQLCVRQDEPYEEIYIWLPEENELSEERVD